MKRDRNQAATTGAVDVDRLLKTRICIKNVDIRTIRNSQQLRLKLLNQIKQLRITDALVLPDRRLALVGLETAAMAKQCIDFLNQTYALGGTHKITVEYAAAKKTITKPKETPKKEDRNQKRKKHDGKDDKDAEKRPKQSFWANDDMPKVDTVNDGTETVPTPAPNSDLEFLKSKQVPLEDLEEHEHEDQDSATIQEDQKPSTRRLFVRNIPFSASESQVLEHFTQYATSVKIIVDPNTDQSKGYGFVECTSMEQAEAALQSMDGSEFQGRVLSISLAEPPREGTSNTTTNKFDSQKDRAQGWASNHVRPDAVLDAVADALGVGQGDVLSVKGDLSAGDAAVRLALGETAVIQENRNYLASHGYDLDDFIQLIRQGRSKQAENSRKGDMGNVVKRSNTAILVKNLPFDTTTEDLSNIFSNASSILLTPSHTLAVIHFADVVLAKNAFRRNAYRRFKKSVPLYLEWAPEQRHEPTEEATESPAEAELEQDDGIQGSNGTLYVKNLNFKTTEEVLLQAFEKFGARSVRIPKKTSTKGHQLSMGYGFVEFSSSNQADEAMKMLQGMLLDDHKVKLMPKKQSQRRNREGTKSNHAKTCKLMVRNIPFQANRKELLQLFGQFGTLKRVRLPKKFDASQHRGFGFVEYVSHKEATAAKTALANTHLYGRHLVIEYAIDEEDADGLSGNM